MPKVSTIGLVNKVRATNKSTQVSDDDTWITLKAGWTGGTITLPGPTSSPGDLPSGGDFYHFGDPIGQLVNGAAHVNGGGFPIQGGASVSIAIAFSEAMFTFDDENQAWIACICLGPLD